MGINNTALTFELQQVSALAAQGLRLSQLADLVGRSEDFVCAALQQCVQLGLLDAATFISVTENLNPSQPLTQGSSQTHSQSSSGASNWFCNPEPDSIRCKSCFFYPSIKKTSILKKQRTNLKN